MSDVSLAPAFASALALTTLHVQHLDQSLAPLTALPQLRVLTLVELGAPPDDATFAVRFDVLHRLFLGYPVRLAPPDRIARFHALYAEIVARHAATKKPLLTPDETAWAAMCSALVQHPEAELY